jgi:hypothetical protein
MLFIISPIETISTTIEQPFELINKVPTEKQSIIGASLIPHYSNIAIDLGIHWTVSALKDVKQATYNTSELIFTPVSYSDAASNRMYNTPTQDKTPVRMPIMNYNYSNDLPPLQGGYTFIKSLKDNPNIINISETSIKVLTNNNFLNTLLDQITNLTFRTNEEVLEIAEIFVVAYNRFKPVKNVSNNKYLIQLSQEELERLPTYRNYIHTNDLQEEVNSIFLKMNELLKDYSSNKEGFSDTDSSSLNSFRDIFKDFFNTCNNFVNDRENGPKTKKPIIHFKFPEKIATMITSLVSFFGSRDQSNNLIVDTKNSNLNTIINYDLFNNYCEYLRFLLEPLVIQDRSLAKKFKEILDSSDRLVTPVIPVIPARTSKRAEEKSKNTRQKRDTQIDKIRFSRITGGTIDTKNNELFITDLVGPYGCYLSIGSNGQFIIEPINTKEKLQEINNMLHNLYSIFTTQTTTNYMAKGILPSISKSNEWWEQVEQKIKSNELYNALPESQKDEMYTKITSKIQENIKTMKDDVAIARAIYDTLKGLQLNVNISNKMTTGRTINDVPNMIKSTMNNGIAVGAGLTRRKLYKNKVTKRRKNNRVRKTKKNKKNKIKKYTRKYRH